MIELTLIYLIVGLLFTTWCVTGLQRQEGRNPPIKNVVIFVFVWPFVILEGVITTIKHMNE